MKKKIIVNDATIEIDEINADYRRINVRMSNKAFSPRTQWTTKYPLSLIESLLQIKGAAYLCDEIAREEDPAYVESDLNAAIFAYADKQYFKRKTILDFGCGAGASTIILARMLPHCRIIGVDIDADLLKIAKLRASFYNYQNITFFLSLMPAAVPDEVKRVDAIVLSAVYEHLLPSERAIILLQLWEKLSPNGILFINQTPDKRFPIETHTTRLPLINYFSDSVAYIIVRNFCREFSCDTWEALLRKGIRGATPDEIMKILSQSSHTAKLLSPRAGGIRRQSDVWYMSSKKRIADRYKGWKKTLFISASQLANKGLSIAPYFSIAVKKER